MIKKRNAGHLMAATSALTLALALTQPVAAAEVNWTGAKLNGAGWNNTWSEGGNWAGGVVPTAADDVRINTLSRNDGVPATYLGWVNGTTGAETATVKSLSVGAVDNGVGANQAWDGDLAIANGSTLTVAEGVYVGSNAIKNDNGSGGDGKLTVSNGSRLIMGGRLLVGDDRGEMTVSNGSSVVVNGPYTDIGRYGTGILLIDSGGTMTSTQLAFIAGMAGSTGTATVTGAGSAWTVGQALSVGENGTGTLNIQNGGLVSAQTTTLAARGSGTINLWTGGILATQQVNRGAGAGIFNLNGGTLRATANTANFITGFTGDQFYIGDSHGVIDTNGYAVTASSQIAGAGGLIKTGNGTLTLTGANSYAGGTRIKAGFLSVSSDANLGAATGSVMLDNGWLQNTAAFSTARNFLISPDNGGIKTDANLTLTGVVSGKGYLVKDGAATLTLTGDNAYEGGTRIVAGTVQVGNGGTSGTLGKGDVLNNGSLIFNRSNAYTYAGVISGSGDVIQRGRGTTILTGANTYAGDTIIGAGTVQVGDGGTSGTLGTGNVNNNGDLVFNRSNAYTYAGVISGPGRVTQAGSGTTVLTGANTYSGTTKVQQGTLAAGAANAFSAASGYSVLADGTLDLAGYDQTLASLNNAGDVRLGNGTAGTTLTIDGNYVGNGGTVYLNTVLDGDDSATDRLNVTGNTSGTGVLAVTKVGGEGALTKEGIKIVNVSGASDGQFTLQGDYVHDGQQAVVGGAYAYKLYQGGVANATDGDWYLRSQLKDPKPEVPGNPNEPNEPSQPNEPNEPETPLYQAGVPVYQAVGGVAQELNGMGTLRQRVGNRYWSGAANPVIEQGDGPGKGDTVPEAAATETATAVWGRIEGSHGRFEPEATAKTRYDVDTYKMQAGVDGKLYENEAGSVIGGVTVHYGNAQADIESASGNGSVDVDGYGVGSTLTWYGDNGLYIDGQAQATWYQSDLGSNIAGMLAEGNDGFGYAVSIETGKRFAIDQHWTITPQAQLTWSSVDFDSFTDTFGVGVSQDADESLKGRLGIAAEYGNAWMGADGKKVQTTVYAIANLHHEFLDGSKTSVDGVRFTSENDATWGGLGTGGSYSWADGKYALYGEVSADTSLENFADSYKLNGNLGLKVSW